MADGGILHQHNHHHSTDTMLDDELTDDPFAATTAGDMGFYLQSLLDRKEKQLQQAGNLGQRVLAQQMELEERIRQIQETVVDRPEEEEVDTQTRVKYRELNETILSWDAENAQLSSAFGTSSKVQRSPPFFGTPGLIHFFLALCKWHGTFPLSSIRRAPT